MGRRTLSALEGQYTQGHQVATAGLWGASTFAVWASVWSPSGGLAVIEMLKNFFFQ